MRLVPQKKDLWDQAWDEVRAPEEIEGHLKALCARRIAVEISLENQPEVFQAAFRECEVKGRRKALLFDSLSPSGAAHLLAEAPSLVLFYHFDPSGLGLHWIPYHFESRWLAEVSGGVLVVRLAWPDLIRRLQRRQFFRVDPSLTEPIRVRFPHFPGGGEVAFNRTVYDVSGGGFSVAMQAPAVKEGQEVKNILMVLPDEYTFTVTAAVRRITQHRARQNRFPLRAAFEFRLFDPPGAEERLSRYIFSRQREMIRLLRRGT